MSLSSSTVGGKIKYKIVLLGDQHVGKTSIIQRFINDRFQNNYDATIGIDFLVRNLTYQNKHYRLQLWDTAGQERFRSLIPSYLKDSNLCLLVYDLGNPKTLENISVWQELYNKHKQYTAFSIAVGNKCDKQNQCAKEDVSKLLKEIGITHHYQISAKSGQGVTELFHTVIDLITHNLNNIKIIDQIDQKEQKEEGEKQEKSNNNFTNASKSSMDGPDSVSVLSAIKLQKPKPQAQHSQRRCC